MAGPLNGCAALVTGASSGIGQAVALRLARNGASVGVVGRRHGRLKDLAAQIAEGSGRGLAVSADITDREEAAAAVDAVTAEFGRLDIVVNAAGLMLNGPSVEQPLDDWETMVDVNLKGLMYITKAALPRLLEGVATGPRGVADVVNISSTAGRIAKGTVAAYNATKFGVTAATEAWRQEFTRSNVRFSVVEPGAVDTELFGHLEPGTRDQYEKMFATVEMLNPDDIAAAIAYIVLSPRRVAVNEIVIRPTDQV
jgi:NADP-dependent 3-hydroxy acid dehydrogenase YdfG